MRSAISITPRFIPCNSSPAPGNINNRKKSTIECTVVSDCPTPTVSSNIRSNPAASHSNIVSRDVRAIPPRFPDAGLGRINTRSCVAISGIRVLSPKILPRDRLLDGSTANTAIFSPRSSHRRPIASINVLFPTPGTPVIPILIDLPVCGINASSTARPNCLRSGFVLSTSVIARAKSVRFPASTPSFNSSNVYDLPVFRW